MSINFNRIFVVMGVSGCGKSSIGRALADRVGGTYFEGDDFHPASNIELMQAGTPLTDEDRWPWLERIAQTMAARKGVVFVGCSALRKTYRTFLSDKSGEPVFFIHLAGSRELIADRMNKREGHFMPLDLLDSQFATLEPPAAPEAFMTVDTSKSKAEIVEAIAGRMPKASTPKEQGN